MKRIFLLILLPFLAATDAGAGIFELSGNFMFNKSNYEEGSFSWRRSWGASFAYHFNSRSGVEVGYTTAVEKLHIPNFYTTLTEDQITSLSWVQFVLGREVVFQPFFKIGGGQLNRRLNRSYYLGPEEEVSTGSLTGVGTLGLKIRVSEQLGVIMQGTTYLSGFDFATWSDNFVVSFGTSLYFN